MRILIQFTVVVLVFLSSTVSADDDWVVPASWDVGTENITFESDGYKLSGTLYLPETTGPVAAVVLPQQAGTATRDNPLYQQKVRLFNSLGYAAFVYDRRGRGESEGPEKTPSYEALAEDAVAAKQAIARHQGVDAEKVGFWGLSQSGWISMMAANKSDAAFVVIVSSPLTTPEEQMDFLAYNYVLFSHDEEAASKALSVRQLATTDYFEGTATFSEVQKEIKEIEDKPWFKYAFIPNSENFPKDIS